jgi:Chemotaxis protein histidine kinase and related kinases
MNETFSSFDENELSEDDLAVLRAFEALDDISTQTSVTDALPSPTETASTRQTPSEQVNQDDASLADEEAEMLMIFLEEATEDIARLRDTLPPDAQAEHNPQPTADQQALERDKAQFRIFQRTGHKLRGTAGAVGYTALSTVAQHIELLAEQVNDGLLSAQQTRPAIAQAVAVLEFCLQRLVQDGKEPEDTTFIAELEEYYHSLGIDPDHPQQPSAAQVATTPTVPGEREQEQLDRYNAYDDPYTERVSARRIAEGQPQSTFMQVENQRFNTLLEHTEQLIDQQMPIEDAQRSLAKALQDLQTAQTQLQQLEQSLSQIVLQGEETREHEQLYNARTSSSLIARILASSEASSRIQQRHLSHRQSTAQPNSGEVARQKDVEAWDELDIERYTEKDLLLRSLREAIVEVARCSARAQLAQTALQMAQQAYIEQVTLIRKDVQRIRLIPFSALLPQIRQVIESSALAQQHQLAFEVSGAQTEIDQQMLKQLAVPLLKMLQTCIADTGVQEKGERQQHAIQLAVSKNAGEITIEFGFSMSIHGGAVEIMHETMQQLHGTLHFPYTTNDNIRFQLRFPDTHDPAHCLIVRSGTQRLLVATNQVQRVGILEHEQSLPCYTLQQLLGPSYASTAPVNTMASALQPLLLISHPITHESMGIVVDEIETEVEIAIKPLKPYLQRPGIAGSAIDGHGNVLLALDLQALLRQHNLHVPATPPNNLAEQQETYQTQRKPRILLADDSAYLRLTIMHMLPQHLYEVAEVRDGREALEQLLEHTPDIFLLDIEMPNLNGYDLLTLMQEYPELQHVKTIMLTSRISDKHKQRALALGAQGYLTKPCDRDLLLTTIEQLLNQKEPMDSSQSTQLLQHQHTYR